MTLLEPSAEVHNAWTIYGVNEDGSEAEEPLAQIGRPQDWGHPRWTYNRFTFTWETAPDGKSYTNHVHCWTDMQRQPGEYPQLFASLISMILSPGLQKELCGRDYLQEEDLWSRTWGKQPPVWRGYDD